MTRDETDPWPRWATLLWTATWLALAALFVVAGTLATVHVATAAGGPLATLVAIAGVAATFAAAPTLARVTAAAARDRVADAFDVPTVRVGWPVERCEVDERGRCVAACPC